MKRFILHSIFFATLLLVILSAFVYPLTLHFEKQAYQSARSPYCNLNRIDSLQDINADILIMGNSRAGGHYNDSLLTVLTGKKCLNIAMAGFPFNFQYHLMYIPYISQNTLPETIILDISPWAFFDYVMPKCSIEMMPYVHKPYFQFLRDISPDLNWFDRFRLVKYAGRIGKVVKELENLKVHPEDLPQTYRKDYVRRNQPLECDTSIVRLFSHFVDECTQNNTRLVLICSPIHHDDGQCFYDMNGFWRIIHDATKGKNVEVYNYVDVYGSDTSYFMDAMHLNCYGRDQFTTFISKDIMFPYTHQVSSANGSGE